MLLIFHRFPSRGVVLKIAALGALPGLDLHNIAVGQSAMVEQHAIYSI
jgi:hypothetical protein